MIAWVAGIAAAVIGTASGVVFTGWFNSLGPAAFDGLGGSPPVTVAYVMLQNDGLDLALREPVTAFQDRAILLGRPDAAQRAAFLERYRAAGIGRMQITVVLEGNRAGLRIADVRPRVLSSAPPSDAALLTPSSAGEAPAIEVVADLDRPVPRLTTKKDPRVPYFSTRQIDLVRGERATLSITAATTKGFYEFEFVATVVSDGHAEELRITAPGGRPFRLTARSRAYRAVYRTSPADGWEPPAVCRRAEGNAC
ncbi:hypothetical protein HTZ77_31805 [Nonomuraea sp. SMC257]|uniref:Uncharacterized protein n=1 Tax=Nonomuraea montanisoli TaxID=2741721 RepID=A0A7Y6ICY7_9ACTN|nr:hypothetical protein [Nonomuraea montanisoli]NUW35970.1 hypothetical protein [Nonomuraea montanisoli]